MSEEQEHIRKLVVALGQCAGGEIHTAHLLPAVKAALEVLGPDLETFKARVEELEAIAQAQTELAIEDHRAYLADIKRLRDALESHVAREERMDMTGTFAVEQHKHRTLIAEIDEKYKETQDE